MMKTLMAVGVALMLAACSTAAVPPAHAADVPTVMIAGEDWDKDTFERDNRVFNRVLDTLMSEFHDSSFRVYDERAMSVKMGLGQERKRRTDTEILDIARRFNSPPIDLVLLFQIYPEVKKLQYVTDVRARIRARLVQVQSGRFIDAFEDTKTFSAPVDCDKVCLWENIGGEAKTIARDVSAWMSLKLSKQIYAGAPATAVTAAPATTPAARTQPAAPQPPAGATACPAYTKDYMLVFDGFTPQEITTVEKYLVIFTDYCSHRPVDSGMKLTRFSYESGISDAHLKRNLDRVLFEVFKAEGMVQQRGNEFTIRKMGVVKTRPVQDSGW